MQHTLVKLVMQHIVTAVSRALHSQCGV